MGFTTSTNSSESESIVLKQALEKIELLTNEVQELKASNEKLWNLHPYLNKESRKKLAEASKEEGMLIGTKFVFRSKSVDPNLDMKLYHALKAYTGPAVKVNSLRRFGNRRSQHHCGQAIDISWDRDGRAMARWLVKEEGQAWLKEYGMSFYLEKIYDKDYRRGLYKKYVFDNPKATGSHIHLHVLKTTK